MAEAIFSHRVREAGLQDQFLIDSAGTGHWHVGEKAHRGTLAVLEVHNIPYAGRARQITRADLKSWDVIVTMDEDNMDAVKQLGASTAKVVPMMSFALDRGFSEVPDPYYDGRYELVYDLVSSACAGLLDKVIADNPALFPGLSPVPATVAA